jgi:hypothetical protein
VICETGLEWKRRVCLSGRCIMADDDSGEFCAGPLQAHHVITQQALRKSHYSSFRWDTRNGICVCERHHSRHTKAVQRIPFERLTPEAIEFARSCNLSWQLDRYYPKESSVA